MNIWRVEVYIMTPLSCLVFFRLLNSSPGSLPSSSPAGVFTGSSLNHLAPAVFEDCLKCTAVRQMSSMSAACC